MVQPATLGIVTILREAGFYLGKEVEIRLA